MSEVVPTYDTNRALKLAGAERTPRNVALLDRFFQNHEGDTRKAAQALRAFLQTGNAQT